MDKGKGMTPDEFIKNALRTNAPTDKAIERFNKINHDDLKKLFMDYIDICNRLDVIKKAIFYGKNYQDSSVGHDPKLTDLMTGSNMNIFHGIIGMATESGEMFEAFLKFMNEGILDTVNLTEEVGDSDWYKAILLNEANISMESMWDKIISKLKERYPHKFTEECAINRNVVAERKILEQ
jgi:NTP pyrophosphatase (non-canonical NTP hydrolase)